MKYQARRIYSYLAGGDNAAWGWEDLGPPRATPEEAFADFESAKAKETAGTLSLRYGDNDEHDVVVVIREPAV